MKDPVKDQEPVLIHPFPEWKQQIRAAFSTRLGGSSTRLGGSSTRLGDSGSDKYSSLNLGFRSGDDPDIVNRNWDAVREKTGLQGKPLVLPRMTHGDVLADADALPAPSGPRSLVEPEGADAVFSRTPDRILAVTMADCLTALIFDPHRRTIAAVHAGWRGTRLGILGKTVLALASEGHVKPVDTWVAFGPCLRPESLEIGDEVAAQLDPKFLLRIGKKFHFDMPACNRAQALAAGIPSAQIRDMGGCTLREPHRYFSYRRDGQASGRLAAFISLV